MSIRIQCPGCGKAIKAGDDWAGLSGACPACKAMVEFPSLEMPPPLPVAQPAMQQVATNHWNPGIAAVLNCFIVGSGQIYKGHIERGLVLLFTYLLIGFTGMQTLDSPAWDMMGLFLLIVALLIWIHAVFDAYRNTDPNAGWKFWK